VIVVSEERQPVQFRSVVPVDLGPLGYFEVKQPQWGEHLAGFIAALVHDLVPLGITEEVAQALGDGEVSVLETLGGEARPLALKVFFQHGRELVKSLLVDWSCDKPIDDVNLAELPDPTILKLVHAIMKAAPAMTAEGN
jgi:hypothetical protein